MIRKISLFLILLFSSSALYSQDFSDTEGEIEEENSDESNLSYALTGWYNTGKGLRFYSPNEDYSMIITGYIQPYYELFTGKDTLGNRYIQSRYRIHRARVKISGKSERLKLAYRLSFDLGRQNIVGDTTDGSDDINRFFWDAFITYRPFRYTRIHFGQKAPRTNYREFPMTSNKIQFVERSRIVSLFSVFRDIGLFIDRRDKIYRNLYIKSYLEITSGEGQNSFTNYGGLKYGGRLDILPLGLFKGGEFNGVDMLREWTPKLVLGLSYTYNDGISSRNGNARAEAERFFYTDSIGNQVLPDYQKIVADFLFKYKGLTLLGTYAKTKATLSSKITEDEATVRGRLNLGEIWNIQIGYLFKSNWSVDLRYTQINDLIQHDTAGSIKAESETFLNAGIYNRPKYYTFGLTKYLKKYATKIQASVTYNTVNVTTEGDIRLYSNSSFSGGQNIDVAIPDEWTMRLIFSFAF